MEGGRVNGVILSGGRFRVGKEMAKVGIASFGAHLGALHIVRSVQVLDEEIFRDRSARGLAVPPFRARDWAGGVLSPHAAAFLLARRSGLNLDELSVPALFIGELVGFVLVLRRPRRRAAPTYSPLIA